MSFLGEAADNPVNDLTPRDCLSYRDHQIKEGRAIKTVNNNVTILRGALEEAVSLALCEENPFKAVKRLKVKRKSRRKHFNYDQFKVLTEAVDGEWRVLIMIAAYTGQRQKDCATLKWKDVDFDRRVIKFYRAKTRDEFRVPIHDSLVTVLQDWQLEMENPFNEFVLPEMKSKPATGKESISDVFRMDILPRIGIVQPYVRRSGIGRNVPAYSFHSLRHSLSSWLNDSGASDCDRMAIVGHTDKRISEQYTHVELEKARRVLNRIPGVNIVKQ